MQDCQALANRRCLILGSGNTASDLASNLLEAGAQQIHLSTRSIPPMIPREWGPFTMEGVTYYALRHLPSSCLCDAVLALFCNVTNGYHWWEDYFPAGMPSWQAYKERRVPTIDKGRFIKGIKDGSIIVHGPPHQACGNHVSFEVFEDDSHRHRQADDTACFDIVILATGYGSGIRGLSVFADEAGHCDGLHTVGFTNGRSLLPLLEIGKESQEVAGAIAREEIKSSLVARVVDNAKFHHDVEQHVDFLPV